MSDLAASILKLCYKSSGNNYKISDYSFTYYITSYFK